MKNFGNMMLSLSIILFSSLPLIAQDNPEVGDYRTRASGDWSMPQNWQVFNGSVWVNIGTPPTGGETITVLAVDSIFVNVAVTITDTLVNQGIVEAVDNFTVGDGGVYQHDRDAGKIPMATWLEGSTLLMTGVTSTAPDDRNQDYYHMEFNTPDLLSNLNMNLNDNTISGDIRVIDTGLARWYLTSVASLDTAVVTLMGDLIVQGGTFSVQGTSNALTTFIIHHYGNIEVTGGNFSISRGSQGGGTTTWYIYEGNFSMSNATTQNSTATVDGAKFVFTREGTQTLTLGDGNTLSALPIEVESGTTLDMGASELGLSSGNFTLNEGATLMTTLAGGLTGIFGTVTGTLTLMEGSSFGFNGTTAQLTSSDMPAVVTDLIIDNAAGVTLSQETTINGVLRLVSGVFDNTIPFQLGPNGTISEEGGSLLLPITSVEDLADGLIPETFFVDQNYPNPFNPSTTIRFGLPVASEVTVKVFNTLGQQVAAFFEGRIGTGVHELKFDAKNLSSGIYLYRIKAGEFVHYGRMLLEK